MPTPEELKAKFWKALRSDMTVMLGLSDIEHGHARPMTAQFEQEDQGPLWFFTSKDNTLVEKLGGTSKAAAAQFVSKDHGLWASISGTLSEDTNPANIDRLWNSQAAAWYEDGKDDPKVALLRLDLKEAEIWLDASSVVAGAMVLLGIDDPKESYKDKVAVVPL